ncbi:MAG: formate--tetrahydrofolate ligase [bacterium]
MTSSHTTRPIVDVAADLGIAREHLTLYGDRVAKIHEGARAAARESGRGVGRLVLVTAITPTDAGEGKTTTSIGLAQGLARTGRRACVALREPSLGPVFGMKGGATGGGLSCVEPSDEINLHFTGDFHAISTAHNLLAALVDNHIHHGNALGIDTRHVMWRRVIDLADRALREVIVGLGGATQGVPRETGFDITPASEVMAALCLAEDADDMRARISRMIVALTAGKERVTAADLKAVGSMMVVLKHALRPNLVQTTEGVPAILHGGPFANIAHGCNSVIATKTALACADWAITEAGFGSDLGAEKFFDIKCRSAGLDTAAVVVVATVRALKRHGGVAKGALTTPDPAAVERGIANLAKHVENVRHFGETPVVAINRFPTDSDDELAVVRRACEEMKVPAALSEVFTRGGDGGVELAETVVAHAERRARPFEPIYKLSDPIKGKMEKIAWHMYGAASVIFTREAERDLELVRRFGGEALPLCVAKTPMSLSDNAALVGRPQGFVITVRSFMLSAGAGFVVAIVGEILRMPGLPVSPQSERIDLVDGEARGLR